MGTIDLHLRFAFADGPSDAPETEIWFESGEIQFPERGWIESGSRLLGNWCVQLREFLDTGRATLYFMEGSFELQLRRTGTRVVEITFIGPAEPVGTVFVEWAQFVSAVLQAVDVHLEELARGGKHAAAARIERIRDHLRATADVPP